MRKAAARLALVLVAVSVIAWPPSRLLIADLLLTLASHLDHAGDPEPSPEQLDRMRANVMAAIAEDHKRRERANGHGPI